MVYISLNVCILLLMSLSLSVRGSTLSDLQDKSRGHRRLPFAWASYLPSFLSRTGFSIPTFQLYMLVDLHRISPTRVLAHSACQFALLSCCHTKQQHHIYDTPPPPSNLWSARPPYWGKAPYSCQVMSATPEQHDRLIGGRRFIHSRL